MTSKYQKAALRGRCRLREQVGASPTGSQQIAGHSSLDMTNEYTFLAIKRQQELTKAIQEKLAAAAGKKTDEAEEPTPVPTPPEIPPGLAEAEPATWVVQ